MATFLGALVEFVLKQQESNHAEVTRRAQCFASRALSVASTGFKMPDIKVSMSSIREVIVDAHTYTATTLQPLRV